MRSTINQTFWPGRVMQRAGVRQTLVTGEVDAFDLAELVALEADRSRRTSGFTKTPTTRSPNATRKART